MSQIQAYRAALLHSLADPAEVGNAHSHEYFADGLLLVQDGKILRAGPAAELLAQLPAELPVQHYPNALICPGFIDTHIHYPQTGILGAYGEDLLHWLETYTFPEEAQFADQAHASGVAEVFLQELLRNGTTTALVFGTVHPQSVDAFFERALALNLRMIAGKVLMDRNAPPDLLDTPQSAYAQSKALIERWHGKGRLHYAVTPRFAPTSSPAQLDQAARLLREYPDLYLHTHLAENQREIDWVAALFPERRDYLDVYQHHGLLGARTVFAHGIHLCDDACRRLAHSGSALAFCPTSNLFLGSGLFDLAKMDRHRVRVGLGTDVGGGTSFSQLRTLAEAYKVGQLRGQQTHPFKLLHLATLGGARALYLDDRLGNFLPGKEADFVILDLAATALLDYRLRRARSLEETLFALITLGDDRVVSATYAAGQCVHQREAG